MLVSGPPRPAREQIIEEIVCMQLNRDRKKFHGGGGRGEGRRGGGSPKEAPDRNVQAFGREPDVSAGKELVDL